MLSVTAMNMMNNVEVNGNKLCMLQCINRCDYCRSGSSRSFHKFKQPDNNH